MDFLIRNWKWIVLIMIGLPVGIYGIAALNYFQKCSTARVSCLEHRKVGCNIDGEYNIRVGRIVSEATCDMTTEGGGWTLVANYVHRKGSPGGPSLLEQGRFPIRQSMALGMDEFKTPAWGHASNSTLTTLPYSEMRFHCRTSGHPRVVDFNLSGGRCFEYIRSGRGACAETPEDTQDLVKHSRGMANNEARLPGIANKGWKDQGDNAITNYPFYIDYRHHWSIGAVPNRFECDDYEPGGTTSTIHQVWVR